MARRSAVVLTSNQESDGKMRVMVAPVTHTPPDKGAGAVEVPPQIGQALGFDAAKSWIVTAEVNTFTWPGPDIRKAKAEDYAFGRLPYGLLEKVRLGVIERNREKLKIVERDEPLPPKDLNEETKERLRNLKPLPVRDRSKDHEQER